MSAPTTFKQAFCGSHAELEVKIDIKNGLLARLRDKGIFTVQQVEACESAYTNQGNAHGVSVMLDLLEKSNDKLLGDFFSALSDNDQGHIVEIIMSPSENQILDTDMQATAITSAILGRQEKPDNLSHTFLPYRPSAQVQSGVGDEPDIQFPTSSCSHCENFTKLAKLTLLEGSVTSPVDLLTKYFDCQKQLCNLSQHVITLRVNLVKYENEIRELHARIAVTESTHTGNIAELQRQLQEQKDKVDELNEEKTKAERHITELQMIVTQMKQILETTNNLYPNMTDLLQQITVILPAGGDAAIKFDSTIHSQTAMATDILFAGGDVKRWPDEKLESILLKAIDQIASKATSAQGCAKDIAILMSVSFYWNRVLKCRLCDIRRNTQVVAGSCLRNIIQECRDFLEKFFEPDFGLLHLLRDCGVLTHREFRNINFSKKTVTDRNRQLLKCLSQKTATQHITVIKALRKTNQSHIANAISLMSDGNVELDDHQLEAKFGDQRPLNVSHLRFLNSNIDFLGELLDASDGLLNLLTCKGFLSSSLPRLRLERDDDCRRSQNPRSRFILSVLRRQSVAGYNCFIECLTEAGQDRLASAFLSLGMIVPVVSCIQLANIHTQRRRQSSLGPSDHDMTHCQRSTTFSSFLLHFFKALSAICQKFQQSKPLQLSIPDCELIDLRKDKRRHHRPDAETCSDVLVAYFLCKSVTALHELDALSFTRKLSSEFSAYYLSLLDDLQSFVVKPEVNAFITVDTCITCVRKFHCKMDLLTEIYHLSPQIAERPRSNIYSYGQFIDLGSSPLCHQHNLLLKSAILLSRTLAKITSNPYRVVYMILAAIALPCWNNIRQLRRRLRQLLPIHKALRQVHSWQADGEVSGIAYLGDRIYVSYRRCNKLHIYGPDYRRVSEITVNGMLSPTDITVCPTTNRLFIADEEAGRVWVVLVKIFYLKSATSKRDKTHIHEITDVERPTSLSIRESRLLVTSESSSSLVFFWQLEEHVRVPLNFEYPSHAVETGHKTFVVCSAHDGKFGAGLLAEMCVDGLMLRTFRLSSPELPELLTFSIAQLFVDSSDQLYAVDVRHNRVLLMDANLKLQSVLLNHRNDGLYGLERICYAECTGRLFIGESSGRLKVFEQDATLMPRSTSYQPRVSPLAGLDQYFSDGILAKFLLANGLLFPYDLTPAYLI